MTRKEQLDGLHRLKNDIPWLDFSIDMEVSLERKQQYRQVLSEIIKALEQESIIDKIRAEIIEMRSKQNCSCADCLDIIDKYKAESEE